MKVSVIVPVYNVERYIGRCVHTLMQQTLQEVEFIFVDDAGVDSSMDILHTVIALYPERMSFVRIIRHEHNKGLPAARNTGLRYATGEYVFHCDSDDFMEHDALERLYETATKNNADIVWCDYTEMLPTMEKCKSQPSFSTPLVAIKAMLTGNMEYNVWNKLAKRSLYTDNGIEFPEGHTMGEDLTVIMLFACAKNVAHVEYVAYHYDRTNPTAVTRKLTREKQESLNHNVKRVEAFLTERFGNVLENEIACLKLNQKWNFLISSPSITKYKMWNEWFPEANHYIKTQPVSFRIKLLEWATWRKQYWVVWLHYWVVIRLFYSVAYKNKGIL